LILFPFGDGGESRRIAGSQRLRFSFFFAAGFDGFFVFGAGLAGACLQGGADLADAAAFAAGAPLAGAAPFAEAGLALGKRVE